MRLRVCAPACRRASALACLLHACLLPACMPACLSASLHACLHGVHACMRAWGRARALVCVAMHCSVGVAVSRGLRCCGVSGARTCISVCGHALQCRSRDTAPSGQESEFRCLGVSAPDHGEQPRGSERGAHGGVLHVPEVGPLEGASIHRVV